MVGTLIDQPCPYSFCSVLQMQGESRVYALESSSLFLIFVAWHIQYNNTHGIVLHSKMPCTMNCIQTLFPLKHAMAKLCPLWSLEHCSSLISGVISGNGASLHVHQEYFMHSISTLMHYIGVKKTARARFHLCPMTASPPLWLKSLLKIIAYIYIYTPVLHIGTLPMYERSWCFLYDPNWSLKR